MPASSGRKDDSNGLEAGEEGEEGSGRKEGEGEAEAEARLGWWQTATATVETTAEKTHLKSDVIVVVSRACSKEKLCYISDFFFNLPVRFRRRTDRASVPD